MTLGFIITLFMVGGSMIKAIVMVAFGLFVSAIGMDPVKGVERFTLGSVRLSGGLDLVPVIVGMFGVSEILSTMEETLKREIFTQKIKDVFPTVKDWLASWMPILRGTFLGFGVGLMPGSGSVMASFLSYAVQGRVSRHPEKFGTGTIEGVAGPEAANNSAVAANMIPLLSLGLPSNAVTALLMGALIIHGVQPGPMLMNQNPDLFWGVIASMYIGNIMLLILNLPLISIWVKFLKIPYWALFPLILLLCVIGSYSANQNMFDVWVMIGFGVQGYLLRKQKYELGPFVLALVLGPLFEQSLRQSLIMSKGDPSIFFTRPISVSLIVVSLVLLVLFLLSEWRKGKTRAFLKQGTEE
jgi:putative tricarboxylic transport membrane protein